jgi:hypothetical protein
MKTNWKAMAVFAATCAAFLYGYTTLLNAPPVERPERSCADRLAEAGVVRDGRALHRACVGSEAR